MRAAQRPWWRRAVGAAAAAALVVVGLVTVPTAATAAPQVWADPTVTADALPTVQIDGVVWSQTIVGNTVYVAGEFATARPAGSAAGVDTTPRANLLAYNLTTGALVTTWAPTLDGPAYAIEASPDGSRLYVGGNFTRVNGSARNRFAVLNATTGALVSGWTGGANAAVRSIVATASTVYIGGNFNTVAGQSRPRVAAFAAATGAITTWRVSVQPRQVDAIALSPNGSQLYIGGRFDAINGVARQGIGAAATSNGATTAWTVNPDVFVYGYSAGITSLDTDGTLVYGTGFGLIADPESEGNLEGMFAADAVTADLAWVDDCHGDSYSVFANPGQDHVYLAGHPHNCGNFGGFPEINPRRHQYAAAVSKATFGEVQPNTQAGYYSLEGQGAPELRTFWPTFQRGTFTGTSQATWHVTGNGTYVVYGGEFLGVNGVPQQGLVRFATSAIAPDAIGPSLSGTALQPTAIATATGNVQVSWPANWDRDDEVLEYRVLRGSSTTPVYEVSRESRFWDLPRLSFTDTGLSNNTTYTYRVVAVDDSGNSVTSPTVTVTTTGSAAGPLGTYATAVMGDNPGGYWRLGDSGGSAVDTTSYGPATVGSGVDRGEPGALVGDGDDAMVFSGDGTSRVYSTRRVAAPLRFSVEAWFRTGSSAGGKIVGFGSTSGTTNSTTVDRHVYLGADGRLTLGVFANAVRTITSPAAYNDDEWHQVVASVGIRGMELYVDGALVASDADVTFARHLANGYWRIGGDTLAGWPNAAGESFVGSIDEVSVYGRQLDQLEIARHHSIGTTGSASNLPPQAQLSVSGGELTVAADASGSSDLDGTIVGYSWSWGDGHTTTTTTPVTSHPYAAAGTYPITVTVTDDDGGTAQASGSAVVTAPNQLPSAAIAVSGPPALGVSVSGAGSTDPDGTISTYQWTFGDGGTATGVTATHQYVATGTYPITLTVSDNRGGTDTETTSVSVVAPPGPVVLAADTFERTVADGFGTADTGGAWSATAGATSVGSGAGSMRLAAASSVVSARLTGVSSTSVREQVTFSLDKRPAGSGGWFLARGRIIDGAGDYRLKIALSSGGGVSARLYRTNAGGTETAVSAAVTATGVTYTTGTVLATAFEVVGTSPTTLRAKVWNAAQAEPAAWLVQATDATPELQAAGHTGLAAILSSSASNAPVVVRVDNYRITAVP
ncbi:PKD domain-containing protein [uncultured Cellulomonas sp.]|uniref:PKD domain-containing protein n=1 Tax=uncultured Cellulomonas sp. TaxID=189682 RepID=UPI0028E799A4|nr:PKD domain-containing protein [uncultured Cellulomonas sp.]